MHLHGRLLLRASRRTHRTLPLQLRVDHDEEARRMTTIPYVDVTGQLREYPQSFDLDQLERLADLVLSREHRTMIEVVEKEAAMDDQVSAWHHDDYQGHEELHEFLGLSWEQYAFWVENGHLPFTVVRHDVDHSLDHALDFARWEASLGICSTYFVLHTAWYFRDFEECAAKCRELQRLGHEVGIHHDTLTVAEVYGGRPEPSKIAEYVMKSTLMRLHAAGVNVRGAAAHGGAGNNLGVWETWNLSQFGLEYEAYHVHGAVHANYVSDNRGVLRAPLEHVEGQPTHLLVHPEHWQIPRRGRIHA